MFKMNIKAEGFYPENDYFSRQRIGEKVRDYGFIEIAEISKFLKLMCGDELDAVDLSYVRGKLGACLRHHDNGSDYFMQLRELASELDSLSWYKDMQNRIHYKKSQGGAGVFS